MAQKSAHPSFRNYSTDKGLASSEVYEIVQDNDGYIWIATDNGLSKFDGYTFRNFDISDGLPENVIFMLQIDNTGKLWMQAMSGKLYFMDNDSIYPYAHNGIIENFKNRLDSSKGFIVDNDGQTVHVSIHKEGVVSISPEGKIHLNTREITVDRSIHILEKKAAAISSIYRKVEKESDDYQKYDLHPELSYLPLYIQSEKHTHLIKDIPYSNKKVKNYNIFRLGEDSLLVQYYDRICLIKAGEILWHRSFPHLILYAKTMRNGSILLGLHFHNGLYVYENIEALKINHYTHWFKGKSVSYVMEDNAGGLWVATNENGIYYCPSPTLMTYDQESGLPDQKITSVCYKNENEIYVGLGNGQLWSHVIDTDMWHRIPMPYSAYIIKDMSYDSFENKLWVSQFKLMCRQDSRWTQAPVNMPGRISKSSENKSYWFSNYLGFGKITEKNSKIVSTQHNLGHRSYVVKEDYNNRVWVGLSNGLYEWANDTLIGQQHIHPAFALRIEDLALSPDSTLIIATKGAGIIFWKDTLIEQIGQKDGLTADMMECLLVSDNNQIWAGTLNGLNLISGTFGNRKISNITVNHGLPSNEINDLAAHKNELWIATKKGLVRYTPNNGYQVSNPPHINNFLVNNVAYDVDNLHALKAMQNNVSISYFSINYRMGESINYRHRLNQNLWSEGLSRTAHFPALNPGDYTFEVQSQNEDGNWSESTAINFVIKPPWWNSPLSKVLLIILLSAVIIAYYLIRTKQIKARFQTQLKIKELESAAFQAQMNPHFIFNCLNSIQNNILQNDKDGAIKYLGKFAELTRSVLNASVKGTIPLAEEIKLLTNYLELENLRFKDRFKYTINYSDSIDLYAIEIPPLLVQPYVENAVKHGLQNKSKEGRISIDFDKNNSWLLVTIRDNGSGINTKNQFGTHDHQHKSFGMSITKNRLDLLSIDKADNVEISSEYNETRECIGTKVSIRIRVIEE